MTFEVRIPVLDEHGNVGIGVLCDTFPTIDEALDFAYATAKANNKPTHVVSPKGTRLAGFWADGTRYNPHEWHTIASGWSPDLYMRRLDSYKLQRSGQ